MRNDGWIIVVIAIIAVELIPLGIWLKTIILTSDMPLWAKILIFRS